MTSSPYSLSITLVAAQLLLCLTPKTCSAQAFSIDFEGFAVGTRWIFESNIGEEDGVLMESVSGLEGDDPVIEVTSAGRAGHLGSEFVLEESAALVLTNLDSQDLSFHYGSAIDDVPASGRLIVNGVATSIAQIADLDGVEVGGTTLSVTSEAVGFGNRGIVTIEGNVQSLTIDGFLSVDHIVGTQNGVVDTPQVRLGILSADPISETEREVRLVARASEEAVLTLLKSADLERTSPWTIVEDAQIVASAGTHTWEITTLVPLGEQRYFFRVSAVATPAP